jgi:hypothetical protein
MPFLISSSNGAARSRYFREVVESPSATAPLEILIVYGRHPFHLDKDGKIQSSILIAQILTALTAFCPQ